MTRKKLTQKRPKLFIAICTLPAFLLTVYFLVWPAIQVLYLSFTNTTALGIKNAKFIGFDNYVKMFGDRRFLQALGNTAQLLLVVPIAAVFFALMLAFMVSQNKLKRRGFYRTVFFFPAIISMTVVSIIWQYVFHPRMGILNSLLNGVGLSAWTQEWLGQSNTALWAIAITLVWQAAGYYMVMHIAAMDSISNEIYEAAMIDGAGPVRRLFRITLPLIKDIVGITYIFALSGTLSNSYILSSVMTGGGPDGASQVLLSYQYDQGIVLGNFGYAMAIAAFTLVVAVLLSLFSRFLSSKQEY